MPSMICVKCAVGDEEPYVRDFLSWEAFGLWVQKMKDEGEPRITIIEWNYSKPVFTRA